MKTHSLADAEHLVSSVSFLDIPTFRPSFLAAAAPTFIPNAQQDQAVVVAAELNSFAKGVDEGTRRLVKNSILFAQLVAKEKAPNDHDQWFDSYFDTLTTIGWLVQEQTHAVFKMEKIDADVENAVLKVAAAMLGAGSTAFQLAKASLEAIEKLGAENPNSAPFTIFNRETQHKDLTSFQLSIAEPQADGTVGLSLLAFRVHAIVARTQVLFFRYTSAQADLEQSTAKFGIDGEILRHLALPLKEQVLPFLDGYVAGLKITPPTR